MTVWNYWGETFHSPYLAVPHPVVLIGHRYFCVVHRNCRKLWGYFGRRNSSCRVYWKWNHFDWNSMKSADRKCLDREVMLWDLSRRRSCWRHRRMFVMCKRGDSSRKCRQKSYRIRRSLSSRKLKGKFCVFSEFLLN